VAQCINGVGGVKRHWHKRLFRNLPEEKVMSVWHPIIGGGGLLQPPCPVLPFPSVAPHPSQSENLLKERLAAPV
jgi:hypothetical protein